MSDYMKILKMIEDGEISPEEGAELLQKAGEQQPNNFNEDLDTIGILEKIDSGEISADEGIGLISKNNTVKGSGSKEAEISAKESPQDKPPFITDEELERWKSWWTIPLYVGLGIVILSTFWMNAAYQQSQYGFWFFCSWIPLLIGLLLIALTWGSRSGPWIHVRVRGPKERVSISIPAPLGLTSWVLRNFGHFFPHLEKTSIDEIILALENTSKNNAPLYVQVDEGESGEHVEVFIG